MLIISNLSCGRNGKKVFSGLNFKLKPGQGLAIVGPNGSGKTTLLRAIAGFLPFDQGQIIWQDRQIQKGLLDPKFIKNIIYLGHKRGVKAHLTPLEHLKSIYAMRGVGTGWRRMDYLNVLSKLELQNVSSVPACQLSAGQQQRLSISMLLMLDAKLWLLDEPFSSIDAQGVDLIKSLIIDHMNGEGIVIFSTHLAGIVNELPVGQMNLAGAPYGKGAL